MSSHCTSISLELFLSEASLQLIYLLRGKEVVTGNSVDERFKHVCSLIADPQIVDAARMKIGWQLALY